MINVFISLVLRSKPKEPESKIYIEDQSTKLLDFKLKLYRRNRLIEHLSDRLAGYESGFELTTDGSCYPYMDEDLTEYLQEVSIKALQCKFAVGIGLNYRNHIVSYILKRCSAVYLEKMFPGGRILHCWTLFKGTLTFFREVSKTKAS